MERVRCRSLIKATEMDDINPWLQHTSSRSGIHWKNLRLTSIDKYNARLTKCHMGFLSKDESSKINIDKGKSALVRAISNHNFKLKPINPMIILMNFIRQINWFYAIKKHSSSFNFRTDSLFKVYLFMCLAKRKDQKQNGAYKS